MDEAQTSEEEPRGFQTLCFTHHENYSYMRPSYGVIDFSLGRHLLSKKQELSHARLHILFVEP